MKHVGNLFLIYTSKVYSNFPCVESKKKCLGADLVKSARKSAVFDNSLWGVGNFRIYLCFEERSSCYLSMLK